MTETASLEVLTDEVCRFLLTTEEVGRVAFLDADDYPVVLPVNYFLDGDFVVFRTAPGTKLREIPLARVAFEVDHLAPANRSGWSVLVQGHGEDVTNAVDPSPCDVARGERRAVGSRRQGALGGDPDPPDHGTEDRPLAAARVTATTGGERTFRPALVGQPRGIQSAGM